MNVVLSKQVNTYTHVMGAHAIPTNCICAAALSLYTNPESSDMSTISHIIYYNRSEQKYVYVYSGVLLTLGWDNGVDNNDNV